MQSPLRSKITDVFVAVADLQRLADGWLIDCRYRQLSEETIKNRLVFLSKFLWWIKENSVEKCDGSQVKGFLGYVAMGHLEAEERWSTAPPDARSVTDGEGLLCDPSDVLQVGSE